MISEIYGFLTFSQVCVDTFSQGLQAEYKAKGIIIQVKAHQQAILNNMLWNIYVFMNRLCCQVGVVLK